MKIGVNFSSYVDKNNLINDPAQLNLLWQYTPCRLHDHLKFTIHKTTTARTAKLMIL